MKKYLFFICLLVAQKSFGQGNHVFSGAEATNLGTVNLSTPGGHTWSTDRSSLPGYFSAIDTAAFTGASDVANINGYVKKYGNGAFTFPVGDQAGTDLRTLSISAPANATDQIGVAYWKGDVATALDPTGGAHSRTALNPAGTVGTDQLASVSPIGFWDWIPVNGTSASTITVSLPDFSGIGGYPSADEIRLAGWNTTTDQWDNLSGTSGASGTAEGSILSGTMSDMSLYSAVAVGSVKMMRTLPVVLTNFTGRMENCNVVLSWTTAYEEGMSHFEVLQSNGGGAYRILEKITSYNSPTGSKYTGRYVQPAGNYSYLLRMVDLDSSYSFSNIVVVNSGCREAQPVIVYPNPAEGWLKIAGIRPNNQVQIYDALGRQVLSYKAANSVENIDIGKYSAGLYEILILDEKGMRLKTLKLIKRDR